MIDLKRHISLPIWLLIGAARLCTSTPQNAISYFNKDFGGRLNVSKVTVFISVYIIQIPFDQQEKHEKHMSATHWNCENKTDSRGQMCAILLPYPN